MDVIDRYFRTLRIFLPNDQRDDIIRELSEEVQSHVAEREAALGRTLETDERAAIVGRYGHPLLTAARYRPPRHLIGPVVFPYYWIVLKVTLVLVAMGQVLGAAVLVGAGGVQVGHVIENAIATALKAAASVTALAALVEFYLARSRALERWSPMASSLPQHAERAIAAAAGSVPGGHRTSPPPWARQKRATEPSASRLLIGVVVGVWWVAGLKFPSLFFGSAAGLEWGHAMDRLYPVLVIAQFTMIGEQFLKHMRPEITGLFRVTRFVWLAAGTALIYLVATSDHQWMVWSADAAAGAHALVIRFAGREISLIEFVNRVWSAVFIAVAASSGWVFIRALFRRFRGTQMAAHA